MPQKDRLGAHNERMKLMSTTSNALALAFVGFAIVRPVTDPDLDFPPYAYLFLATGLALHALSHYLLGKLRKED